MSALETIVCVHCGESAQSAPLLCFCGPVVTCDMCDGDGCRCCGRWGWLSVMEAEERVEDADELNAAGGYDSAGRGYDAADYAACAGTPNLGEGR